MSYHFDVNIESAALLTFACLKARDGECSDILDQIAVTWDEMKRPDIHASAADRQLLAILQEPDAPTGLSALGQLVWAVSGEPQRAEIALDHAGAPHRWDAFYI